MSRLPLNVNFLLGGWVQYTCSVQGIRSPVGFRAQTIPVVAVNGNEGFAGRESSELVTKGAKIA